MHLQRNRELTYKKILGIFTFMLLSYMQINTLNGQVKPARQAKPVRQVKPAKPVKPIITTYPRPIKVAEEFQASLDEPSEILKPADASENKKYPLLIFMPFTGGSAERYFSAYKEELNADQNYIVMLPPEAASEKDHSWQGFEAATFRYENRILNDLKMLKATGIVDTTKIVLIGYSMGGDISWAIAQRYPELFKGAIISGSRTGWSEKNGLLKIKSFGSKYYFGMGTSESDERLKGLNGTINLLKQNNIPYMFERVEGEHEPVSIEMLKTALNFILY